MKIDQDSEITLNFAISFSGGEVVDSNLGQAACTFTYGDGSLLPGFEAKLLGMSAGQNERFQLTPEEGFGAWDEANQMGFPLVDFSTYDELQPGLVLSFADAASTERPGVVKEVNEEQVIIDFNHPLAGRQLVFEVHIHSVKQMARDEK